MSHGEVRTWYMTEEERQAYIAKHPIIPTEKTKTAVKFSTVTPEKFKRASENSKRTNSLNRGPSILDTVDKVELHKRFMAGESLEVIAAALKMPRNQVNYCVGKFRELEPDRWPRRQIRRNSPERKTK